jgi:hypothetical protein
MHLKFLVADSMFFLFLCLNFLDNPKLVTLWWQGALEDYFNIAQEWSYNSSIQHMKDKDELHYSPNIPLHVVAFKI